MISSEEFQQKLQAGKIQAALALVLRDSIELDVTTRMTEDSTAQSQSSTSEYLRSKINLLTGEIHNEVGKDIIVDSTNYARLQQLHIDQIVASHRLVQDYLDRIKSIVSLLPPGSIGGGEDSLPLDTEAALAHDESVELTNTAAIEPPPLITNINISTPSPNADVTINDDIDLSIDEDGTVWEEWIETEESIPDGILPPSRSAVPASTIPDWEEHSIHRNFQSIDIKPTISRHTPKSVDFSAQWDKFVPEYIGIVADPQPQIDNHSNSRQIDRSS